MTDKDLVFRNYNEHFEPQPPSHHPYRPSPYRNSNELGTKKILHSRQQRRVGLLIVEATSNKRLRRDFGMEGKLSGSGTIRHIIQVCGYRSTMGSLPYSERLTRISRRSQRFGNERFIPRFGRQISLAFSMFHPD
jgi:hypothetical protein